MSSRVTADSLAQSLHSITKNKREFYPCVFNSADELSGLSKKKSTFGPFFDIFDVNRLGRIDAFEVVAFCIWAVHCSFEKALEQVFTAFSFNKKAFLGKFELFLFIDAFFRSVAKVCVPSNKEGEKEPLGPQKEQSQQKLLGNRSIRITSKDITDYVEVLFGTEQELNKFEFISSFLENKSHVSDLLVRLKNEWNSELEGRQQTVK